MFEIIKKYLIKKKLFFIIFKIKILKSDIILKIDI